MSNTKIGTILSKLLSENKLRVSELARQIKLPQPTIQRIASGVCENPHTTSLKPIAHYFSITVDQLRGLEPIPLLDNIFKLPLISWSEAKHWNKKNKTITNIYVLADIPAHHHSYALKVLDGAMDPIFPRDTILIVDPSILPKDKSYVIVLVKNIEIPIFRQLIINGSTHFLKPLNPDTNIYKITRLKDTDHILGTIIQARHNYLD